MSSSSVPSSRYILAMQATQNTEWTHCLITVSLTKQIWCLCGWFSKFNTKFDTGSFLQLTIHRVVTNWQWPRYQKATSGTQWCHLSHSIMMVRTHFWCTPNSVSLSTGALQIGSGNSDSTSYVVCSVPLCCQNFSVIFQQERGQTKRMPLSTQHPWRREISGGKHSGPLGDHQ